MKVLPWRPAIVFILYGIQRPSELTNPPQLLSPSHSFKHKLTPLCLQLYPGGGSVVKLMETLSDWLLSMPLQRIPYQAVLDLVDNKMRVRR